MSTRITVTSTRSDLVARVKQVQQANREAQIEKEFNSDLAEVIDDRLEELTALTAPPTGGTPDTSVDRRPAAHRNVGDVMGVTYTLTVDSSADRTLKLRVGTANFDVEETVYGIFDPGLTNVNDITLPAGGQITVPIEALGGLHYYVPGSSTAPYQVWTGLDLSGTGSAPRLYGGTTPPPLDTTVDTWSGTYDTYSADCSASLVLPAGGKACVFIYIHNKIKIMHTYKRITRRHQESINPRTETRLNEAYENGVWYDLQQENLTINEPVDTYTFAAYEIFAFYVKENSVAPFTLSTEGRAVIQAIYPPVSANTTASKTVYSGGGQVSAYGPGSSSYFYTIPSQTAQRPSVSRSIWQAGTLYGSYPNGNDFLAKSFGLGYLQYAPHTGNFFTPAVFYYLDGVLNLQAADAQEYSAMRAQMNGRPPAKFLAPCVNACTTDDTDIYSTTTQPLSVTTPVPADSFRLQRKYKAKNGQISTGNYYLVWDWDAPSFCRRQLSRLGLGYIPHNS